MQVLNWSLLVKQQTVFLGQYLNEIQWQNLVSEKLSFDLSRQTSHFLACWSGIALLWSSVFYSFFFLLRNLILHVLHKVGNSLSLYPASVSISVLFFPVHIWCSFIYPRVFPPDKIFCFTRYNFIIFLSGRWELKIRPVFSI